MSLEQPAQSSQFDRAGRKLLSVLGVDVRPGEGPAAILLFLFFFLPRQASCGRGPCCSVRALPPSIRLFSSSSASTCT